MILTVFAIRLPFKWQLDCLFPSLPSTIITYALPRLRAPHILQRKNPQKATAPSLRSTGVDVEVNLYGETDKLVKKKTTR